jgi:hypothetical protein
MALAVLSQPCSETARDMRPPITSARRAGRLFQHATTATRGHTYYCERPCGVFTVTGRPRNEPWRPYWRIVSPERALQPLSVDPWRATVSLRVIIADDSTLDWRRAGAGSQGCLRRGAYDGCFIGAGRGAGVRMGER